jgi:DNA-binding protein HU-beta
MLALLTAATGLSFLEPERSEAQFLWPFLVPVRKNPHKMRLFCCISTARNIKITTQSAGIFTLRGGFMAAGMTKTQLVRHLAEKVGANNKTAAAFLENLADTAIKETKKSGVFVVPGLGRLVKAHRKARMGRNPQTGEPIQIKAKTVVKFRVAKAAKDAIAPKK